MARAPTAALVAIGLFWGSLAGYMPEIKARTGLSDVALGATLLMSSLGAVVATALAPRMTRLLGHRLLPTYGIALALVFMPLSLAQGPLALGGAMLLAGLLVTGLDIGANLRISVLESDSAAPLMNLCHACYSLTFAAVALAIAGLRAVEVPVTVTLPALALIALGLALSAMRGGRMPAPVPEPAASVQGATRVALWPLILPGGAILFCAFIGENGIEAWSALHLERTLGAAAGAGALGPFMMGLVMGLGRLGGQAVAARLGAARLITVSAAVAVLGLLMLAAAQNGAVALAGIALGAAGLAVLVPTGSSLIGRLGAARAGERGRTLGVSRAWMFGMLGFFAGPTMMGALSEAAGLRMAFAVLALVVGLILPALVLLLRAGRHGA